MMMKSTYGLHDKSQHGYFLVVNLLLMWRVCCNKEGVVFHGFDCASEFSINFCDVLKSPALLST